MNDVALYLVLFFAVLVGGLSLAWWFAARAKGRLEKTSRDRRQHSEFAVSGPVATSLTELSPEPIFLKQDIGGVSVQLENRPFIPVHFLTEAGLVAALRDVAATITERFGVEWSCLVTSRPDGTVSVRRLQ